MSDIGERPRCRNKNIQGRSPASIGFENIVRETSGKLGIHDIACPLCGPSRRTQSNQRRKVMRVWWPEAGFATYNCARCGEKGHVSDRDPAGPTRPTHFEIRAEIARKKSDEVKVRQARALAIWGAAGDLAGTLALSYLIRPIALGGRALEVPEGVSGRVLRFHPRCPWGRDYLPALIGLYRDISTDEPKAIWRCALSSDGRKIDRMALGPKGGCAIKLTADEDVGHGLHVGEGVETMIATMMLGFMPAWALGDAGGVETFPVLSAIEVLTICVDNDADAAGQTASAELFDRWTRAGREVWSIIPNNVDADMNDVVAGCR
jgi:putative DNA primase/helicase